jgi:hypothetical protein
MIPDTEATGTAADLFVAKLDRLTVPNYILGTLPPPPPEPIGAYSC